LVDGAVGGLELFDYAASRLGASGRVRSEALEFFGLESLAVSERGHASVPPFGFGLFEYTLELLARSVVDLSTR
jgi:hypothetical protein